MLCNDLQYDPAVINVLREVGQLPAEERRRLIKKIERTARTPAERELLAELKVRCEGNGADTVLLTRVRKAAGVLSKRLHLDEDGRLANDNTCCAMTTGTATRVGVGSAADLADLIADLGSDEALVLGAHAVDADAIKIVTAKRANPAAGLYARSLQTFSYRPSQPALALIDHDRKGMPDAVRQRLETAGGLEGALAALLPGYEGASRVIRASTSAGLRNAETGEAYPSSGGMHVYVAVADGSDVGRLLRDAQQRAWLAGLGWVVVGQRGQLLIRSIIDVAVGSPERLVFEGAPIISAPLVQDVEARRPVAHEGALLDTKAALPPPTADETRRYEALVAEAKRAAQPAADEARERAAEGLAQTQGISLERARTVITSSLERGELLSDDELTFDDAEIGTVTVADVLADPATFHGETLADPLEGRAYGRGKARLYWNADNSVIVHSFAHGGGAYKLGHDPNYIETKLRAAGKDAPAELNRLLPHTHDMSAVEQDRLIETAASVGKASKTSTKKDADAACRKAREQARARASGAAEAAGEHADAEPVGDWKARLDAAIARMNERYFVATVSGRTVIGKLAYDEALKRQRLLFLKREDLAVLYANRPYMVGHAQSGREIWKDLGTAWLEHRKRRTYSRIALIPTGPVPDDVFNLWRGFGVEPRAGRWPTIDSHLREIVCAGNEEHHTWLMGWVAYCVQEPGRQAEVAVVLRGLKGTGKGMVGQMLMRVFRNHALHITHSRHLVGNFNSHLADALLLFLDEAYWAGDKQGEGVLKALITEPTLMIEPKGIDVFPMPNRLKIIMASNAEWVVPASADERRHFVLDVSDRKRGDTAYFAKLHAAIEGDELAAMLHDLLAHDLAGWSHRTAPHTAGLNQQKLISADSVTRFWLDCLHTGGIVASGSGWPVTIPVGELHAAYVNFAHDHGDRYPVIRERMAERMRQLCPGLETVRPRGNGALQPRQYKLKSLDVHRAEFLAAMGIETDAFDWWDGEDGE